MRNRTRFVAGILVGCLSALTAPAAKVGVLLKAKTAFWASMEKGAVETGSKLGVEVVAKAPLSENDISVQIQLLNTLVAQGVDALVVAPSSKDALSAPIAAAAAKEIKIVVVDSPLADSAYPFVGTNHREAGETAGALLSTLVGDTDEVAILRHNQTSVATADRETGAIEKLRATKPKLTVHSDIYASTEKGVEDERCALLLSKYPKTTGIIATGSAGTLSMMKLLQEKHSDGSIKFIGFGFNLPADASAAIEAGALQGWVAQQPYKVGAQSIEIATTLIKGGSAPAVTHTPVVVITKKNLNSPEVQALRAL